MSVPVIAFFNNKGGVGKTSLVYHVAWMMADQGFRVVAADLDPQGNLSAAFLDDDRLEQLWPEDQRSATIYGAIQPLQRGVDDIEDPVLEAIVPKDIEEPVLEAIRDRLALIPGDIALADFEDELSYAWPRCFDRVERPFHVISAFWRAMQRGAEAHRADVILTDLGPNLGAINRAALIASDSVVIPLAPDLFSLQALRNLGPTLRAWRRGWAERIRRNPANDLTLPAGMMKPIGYIVMQHSVRRDRPVKSYDKWIARIPHTYRRYVLDSADSDTGSVTEDPECFALLKHYRSLMPMAQEARKPMFHLRPADGALGAHTYAVQDALRDFRELATEIARRSGVEHQ